ncbi:hypothetical protein [Flavobacterium sp. I3-2]|uniref:hypothetical protein n=1 Tax=Flavobacterium sp. I3-2 TaxID=2748319 RepID=UPI0015AB0EE7|nr:hypothetical protein [Flavobacterium sp. I3-2]
MVKKTLGIFFIIIASLSTVITLLFIPTTILSMLKHFIESESTYDYEFLFGKLIGILIKIIIIILLWTFGLRWSKNQNHNSFR